MLSPKVLQNIPFFFIIGRPRSGTTLLRTMLDAHPNLLVPPESPVILNLSDKYSNIGKTNNKLLHQFYKDLHLQKKFKFWPLAPELEDSISSYPEPDFQSLIKLVYLHYQSVFPKEKILLLGDKNPNYSINIEKIFSIFTQARFIHLLRDPRDHAASVMKVDFVIPSASLIAFRWKLAYKKITGLEKRYPDQFLALKYEDLVSSPQPTLEKICSFLSVDFHNNMLSYHNMKDEILKTNPLLESSTYHKNLFQPISSTSVGKWHSALSYRQVAIIESICGNYMNEQGYTGSGKKGTLTRLNSLPGILLGRLSLVMSYWVDRLPFYLRSIIRNKPSLLAFFYNRFF